MKMKKNNIPILLLYISNGKMVTYSVEIFKLMTNLFSKEMEG